MNKITLLFCVLASMSISCNQEGVGGKADVSGAVLHQDEPIPGAIIYIAYGASSWPGYEADLYDDQTIASSTDATFSFTKLYKGDYYLWAVGVEPGSNEEVKGGVGVLIQKKKETLEIDVPVIK